MRACSFALLALLTLAGCAVRATAHPAEVQWLLLYGRQASHCLVGEIPSQLAPQTAADEKAKLAPRAEAAPSGQCVFMEVGAKSYADTLLAIGSVLAAIWAHAHW